MTTREWETQEEWANWVSRANEIEQVTITFSLDALRIDLKNQLDAVEEFLPSRLQTFPPKIQSTQSDWWASSTAWRPWTRVHLPQEF